MRAGLGVVLVGAVAAAVTIAAPALARPTARPTPAGPTAGHASHLLLHGRHVNGAGASENWSGYVQTGPKKTFKRATAAWTVPTLTTQYPGYSSTWVGIDGDTDQYLIQTGTEGDVVNGHTVYDAWYEVITPQNEAPEQVFSGLTIHPGDQMTASVVQNKKKNWTTTVTDTTTGQSGTHTVTNFAGPGESAEWIQEDTDVNGYISAAPDWQSVSFSNLTVNGANPNLAYSQSIDIYDSHNTQEDSTGAPTGGNAFSITWLATGTRTPVG